jgi:hypothetical protein
MPELLEKLNKTYFWDINPDLLDEKKSKRIIIERVMNFGNLREIKLILSYYGKEDVTKTICNLNYIDPKTLNFLSLLLNVPKSEFKCYIRKQSTSQPWSY